MDGSCARAAWPGAPIEAARLHIAHHRRAAGAPGGAGARIRCGPVILAQLAPAIDGVRLSLHVLAATIWVGGQLTVAGLLPTVRRLGSDAPRRLARSFARLSWPAYAVLLATGVWNVVAVAGGQSTTWQVLLGVKIGLVVVAGVAAWLHPRATSPAWLGVWGAVTGLASVAALVMGVFLAG